MSDDIEKAAASLHAEYVAEMRKRYSPNVGDTEEIFRALVAKAIANERERCAKVVEARCIGFADQDAELNEIASEIRGAR